MIKNYPTNLGELNVQNLHITQITVNGKITLVQNARISTINMKFQAFFSINKI
ncbi:hypothetical protein B4064_1930 [Caldibacillus thermoamylovorans]|jgi:hypothetical protein|uniref:Uncharacterized protein n=1 Tax=Caldibacillus thermoamylovorans TaxID=35841 RepID=A0A0D0FFZ9_9BACI|nr:hypothetical protein B4065_0599 [Caldibacillus thermoamylovorans]KIO67849.1 hypothetical protein B4064_1930 [Caldibacillus thermoamylovorans]KIO71074.1 hypothetical protein B4166_0485 [Caldibacillus thermoamylovorans]KIO74114.1 hypothetical protein B4167_0391 [Caldibacillus thermoamylovorans]